MFLNSSGWCAKRLRLLCNPGGPFKRPAPFFPYAPERSTMKSLKINPRILVITLAVLSLLFMAFPSGRTHASKATPVASAAQNEDLDFTLVNGTGYSIKKVYIGPSNNPEWTEDMEVLRGRTFKSGTSIDIVFNPRARATKWDLRVEWSDGDTPVNWYGLDLTTIEELTLLYNADTGKTSIRRKP